MFILRNIPPITDEFIELTDTPTTYSGSENSVVFVKSDASGLDFTNFSYTSIILSDGSVSFTSTISGIDPTEPEHLATKYYIDNIIATISGGTFDHGSLNGLLDNDHPQYLLVTDFTTYSGAIVAQIPTDYYTTSEVDALIAAASGTTDHSLLTNLDYASSGHTGFQPAGDYITEAEFTVYSGTLQDQITDNINNISLLSGTVSSHILDTSIHYTMASIDHGTISGLTDDDHPQYILVDGTRGFTSTVSGVSPIQDYELATKGYVDGEIATLSGSIVLDHGGLTGLLDDDHPQYLTRTDFTTYSGTLQSQITINAGGILINANNIAIISGTLASHIADSSIHFTWASVSGTIDHNTILNTHNLTTDIDHGSISGLGDDDHPQYILTNGSRGFTSTVSGVYPILPDDLVTKEYVDYLFSTSSGTNPTVTWTGYTTNSGITELFLSGISGTRYPISLSSTTPFYIAITGHDQVNNDRALYIIEGGIANDLGTTYLVGCNVKTTVAEDDTTWEAWVEADNTNDALVVKVSGDTTNQVYWQARLLGGTSSSNGGSATVSGTPSYMFYAGGDGIITSTAGMTWVENSGMDISEHVAIGNNATINASRTLNIDDTVSGTVAMGTAISIENEKSGSYTFGVYSSAANTSISSAELTALYGFANQTTYGSSITDVFGIHTYAGAGADAGNISRIAGGFFTAGNAFSYAAPTSVTSIAAVEAHLNQYGSPGGANFSVTNAYGINIKSTGAYSAGTATNLYGLYIGDQSNSGFDNAYNIYSSGINSINKFEGSIETNTLTISGTTQVHSILDEDDMASDSDTALATQQSIKAYVDSTISGTTTTPVTYTTYETTASGGQYIFNFDWSTSESAFYINGVRQFPSAFTETHDKIITLASGVNNGDDVYITTPYSGYEITASGGQTVFTISSSSENIGVYVQGVRQSLSAITISDLYTVNAPGILDGDELFFVYPADDSLEYEYEVTASGGQTLFTMPWSFNHIAVFVNGIRQYPSSYTELGNDITLSAPLNNGDLAYFTLS